MKRQLEPLIGPWRDKTKAAWHTFTAQPGNTHIALAAVLLLALLLLLALSGNGAVDGVAVESGLADTDPTHEQVHQAAIPGSDSVVESATMPAFAPPAALPATVPTTDATRVSESDIAVDTSTLPTNRLVIILDDIGYNAEAGERAVNLSGAVTYAVLPFTPHGQALAKMAHAAGKEVMLHAPMSNLADMDLGEGGLTLTLTEDEFVRTLRAAIADIPHVAGVNNHTGSELTAAEQPMQWVMRELKAQNLFFVDSMTTGKSVAEKIAIDNQVPALKRHVFLDNDATLEAIDREFQRAVALAQQQGYAVAIGHPYPATLEYLEQAIDTLPGHNITLVPASALLTRP